MTTKAEPLSSFSYVSVVLISDFLLIGALSYDFPREIPGNLYSLGSTLGGVVECGSTEYRPLAG